MKTYILHYPEPVESQNLNPNPPPPRPEPGLTALVNVIGDYGSVLNIVNYSLFVLLKDLKCINIKTRMAPLFKNSSR